MIVQLKGKVNYPITLDPTVWIFDDRKIILEEAFISKPAAEEVDTLARAAENFNQELFQRSVRPPVNKSINRFEREKILVNSYVMPLIDFINHAEVHPDATSVILKTESDDVIISLEQLREALVLFSINGKPLTEDGPIHLFFGDGSNEADPIKHVKEIIID